MKQKEKLEEARRLYKDANEAQRYVLELLFPELAESEDEKIRKEILEYVRNTKGQSIPITKYNSWIAWLEKQGEQKKSYDTCDSSMMDNKKSPYGEKRDFGYFEEKPTDKVEPKFKVGDWVVFNNKHQSIYQVEKIEDGYYILRHTHGGTFRVCVLHDESLRFWNISDAKRGDVLVDEDNNIGVYKKIEGIDWDSYIYLGCDGVLRGFSIGGKHEQTNTHPATKEQRDQLEKAMANAGHTFDFEKKELEEIEDEEYDGEDYGIDSLWHAKNILEKTLGEVDGYQTDDGILSHKCAISFVDELYKQKSDKWSEEDKNVIDITVWWLYTLCDYLEDSSSECITDVKDVINRLEALKDRVQPQPKQEWSEEDEKRAERLLGWLDTLVNYIHHDAIVSLDLRRERMQQVEQLKTWLKFLRPQK